MDSTLAFEDSSIFFPSFPCLEGKKIGVFYSGGMDSQVVSAALLRKGYDITLITVNNGAMKDISTPRKAAEYLYNLDCEGKVIDNTTGKEVNAKLRFNAINVGVETNEVDGIRHSKLHNKFIEDETGTMWEMYILDEN
jgi:predicted subunit of tRNA(5-methylaminomethyl-2-thiouridylate) methyltransferase